MEDHPAFVRASEVEAHDRAHLRRLRVELENVTAVHQRAMARHPQDPRAAFLGDWIVISVCHLDVLMKQAEAAQEPLALFVQGNDFGRTPAGIDFDNGQVTFPLARTTHNKDYWHPFLYNPLFDPTICACVDRSRIRSCRNVARS